MTGTIDHLVQAVRKPVSSFRVSEDITGLTLLLVNVYFIRTDGGWVLVDTGLRFSSTRIIETAAKLFGADSAPDAIILTHGHFDQVGALHELLRKWDVPVYAHRLELPYLSGQSKYPPGDPSVGGGLMAWSSPLYPWEYDFGSRVSELPDDGSIPMLPGWRCIHTPGHAPGQVALFRDSDRVLLGADAFVTQKQESLLGVLSQSPHRVKGPPTYFTIDWTAAKQSVQALAALNPAIAATGHGLPIAGQPLTTQLNDLAKHFDELAVPTHGRYVREPAVSDASGIVSQPPNEVMGIPTPYVLIGVAALTGFVAAKVCSVSRANRTDH